VFSTAWNTQRDSQSWVEKRRGRKETEVARRIKGGIKRRKTDPASNLFPKCSPQPGTHKEKSQSCVEKRREREDRGDLVEKKESQKGERAIKPVISLPNKNWY